MHNEGLNVQGISGESIYLSPPPNCLVVFLNKSFTQYVFGDTQLMNIVKSYTHLIHIYILLSFPYR